MSLKRKRYHTKLMHKHDKVHPLGISSLMYMRVWLCFHLVDKPPKNLKIPITPRTSKPRNLENKQKWNFIIMTLVFNLIVTKFATKKTHWANYIIIDNFFHGHSHLPRLENNAFCFSSYQSAEQPQDVTWKNNMLRFYYFRRFLNMSPSSRLLRSFFVNKTGM